MLRFLFRRSNNESPQSIADAVARLSETQSSENRQRLHQLLLKGQLRLAAREIPTEWGETLVVLKEATSVTLLSSSAPDGTKALLAFTTQEKLAKRAPNAAPFAMESRAVLELVLAQDFGALVIDPSGPWADVSRAEVEALLNG